MSRYIIHDVKHWRHIRGKAYFLDANIWILRLDSPLHPQPYEEQYLAFFDQLIEHDCKIVVCPVLISEVLNTYLRLEFDQIRRIQPTFNYKKDYCSSPAFHNRFQTFRSEFDSYKPFLQPIHDDYDSVLSLQQMQAQDDFNDFYYANLCGSRHYPIVTHDRDFQYPGVEVITNNKALLRGRYA